MEPKRSSYWKFVLVFIALVVFALAVVVAARAYELWRANQTLRTFNQTILDAAARVREAQTRDTYGGKTPQETLRLYIDAVEKGDYELASKYFVAEKQAGELKSLRQSPRENIENVLGLLKQDLQSLGSYSEKYDGYVIRKPLLVDFMLYPNGIWKIIEI